MSNSERVYEGTLHWPLGMGVNGILCCAPANESLPPWGIPEGEEPDNPRFVIIIDYDMADMTLDDIKNKVESHMRELHNEEV